MVYVTCVQAEQNAARMLMMQLTDGAAEVRAMEYRPIPALSASLTAGTKVTLLKLTMLTDTRSSAIAGRPCDAKACQG